MSEVNLLQSALKSTASSELVDSLIKTRQFNWDSARPLSENECNSLEDQGNFCNNWSQIKVDQNFVTDGIYNCRFENKVYLPCFKGKIKGPGNIEMPAGLAGCSIQNSILENGYYNKIAMMSDTYVSEGAWLSNIGTLNCNKKTRFNIGEACHPGSESRNRSVWLLPGLNLNIAVECVKMTPDLQTEFQLLASEWCEKYSSEKTVIENNVLIVNTSEISSSWIGKNCVIENTVKVSESTFFSNQQNPINIKDGVIIERSMVQSGAALNSGSQMYDSILLEHSSISESAIVHQSVVGSNSHLSKGEVTSSLLGPFVGLHHQSLLISAIWPGGRGNIAYGAKVGSNHTGRNPDQEVLPGEGMFFGLGCQIKFPSNFMMAPYTLIAPGVTANPQRLKFPFSLVLAPGNSDEIKPGSNIIYPGWMWYANPYALFRNMFKFSDRDKCEPAYSHNLFTEINAEWTLEALEHLQGPHSNEVYSDKDIPGLGSNTLFEKQRLLSIKGYSHFLYFFILETVMTNNLKNIKNSLSASLLKVFPECFTREFLFSQKSSLDILESALADSLQKDFTRGEKIFDDYSDFNKSTNSSNGRDPVLQRAGDWIKKRKKFIETH